MSYGKSLRIFLPDATIAGLRRAEVVNRTVHALACPRSRLPELREWPETSKPGVYFLFEARLGDSKPLAYIGESDKVSDRIISHDRKKEFWNEVVIFTSKDDNLTKSHVKYLESRLEALATAADRYTLENGNTPTLSSLPRAEQEAMNEFVDDIRLVLGTLGYPILEPLVQPKTVGTAPLPVTAASPSGASSPDLTFKVHHLVACGLLTDEGFVLKKGSMISKAESDSAARRVMKLKEQLIADGRLVEKEDHFLLSEDLLMSSPSYAAVLVAGTARSGPQSWFAGDGRSLKAIEDAAASETA